MSGSEINDSEGRRLSTTVWTALDRKAGAVIELTIKQLRNKTSTWTVFGVSTLLLLLLSAFYVDSVRDGFESIDNDGDSVDYDGDGYPLGQERNCLLYTSPSPRDQRGSRMPSSA